MSSKYFGNKNDNKNQGSQKLSGKGRHRTARSTQVKKSGRGK